MLKQDYWPILNIPEGVVSDYSIRHRHYKAGYEFVTATARTALFGQKAEPVVFKHAVHFHELHQKEQGTWMTDVPVEQAQANNIVRDYEGTVLVGGLGLGYAATCIALNPNVGSVTVIEIAPEVISLVVPHLPKEARVKMEIVCMDLFEYLKQINAESCMMFDHAFYDIWRGDNEGTFFDTVVPLLHASKQFFIQPDCWNEDVMRGQLFFGLHQRIEALTQKWPDDVKIKMPTLDELCEKKDTIWWDWAVPFFQWYREQVPNITLPANDPRIQKGMSCYTQLYGRPIFKAAWPEAVEH